MTNGQWRQGVIVRLPQLFTCRAMQKLFGAVSVFRNANFQLLLRPVVLAGIQRHLSPPGGDQAVLSKPCQDAVDGLDSHAHLLADLPAGLVDDNLLRFLDAAAPGLLGDVFQQHILGGVKQPLPRL